MTTSLKRGPELDRWQLETLNGLVGFRVETAPDTFEWLCYDGTRFVRVPAG